MSDKYLQMFPTLLYLFFTDKGSQFFNYLMPMKKFFLICLLVTSCCTAKAQTVGSMVTGGLLKGVLGTDGEGFELGDVFDWGEAILSFRINGYTTNYWTATLLPLDYAYSIHVDRDMPDGLGYGRMRSPYRRTFSHPFHRFGNLAIGPSASIDFEDVAIGFFGAVKYKTHEVFYDKLGKGDDNDRAHYISPELGVRLNFGDFEVNGLDTRWTIEAGASYDVVIGYNGHVHDFSKKAIKGGFNAMVGFGYTTEEGSVVLKYTHPLHNFYNEDFSPDGGITHPLDGFKYKIGLLSLEFRTTF